MGRTPSFKENRDRGFLATREGKKVVVLPTDDDAPRELIVIPTQSPEAATVHPIKLKERGLWPLCFSPDETKLLVRLHSGVSYSRDWLGVLDLDTCQIDPIKS